MDIYIRNVRAVSLMTSLKMEAIIKWRGLGSYHWDHCIYVYMYSIGRTLIICIDVVGLSHVKSRISALPKLSQNMLAFFLAIHGLQYEV